MLTIESITDGLSVKWDGQLILEYHFQTGGPRPYWHPLRLPDSPILTMDRPADHVHHQGMWVAWKKVPNFSLRKKNLIKRNNWNKKS